MNMYTHSNSLYDYLTGIERTPEKRLLIDLAIIRKAFEVHEIYYIAWVPSMETPTDAMTKYHTSPAFKNVMTLKNCRFRLSRYKKEQVAITDHIGRGKKVKSTAVEYSGN